MLPMLGLQNIGGVQLKAWTFSEFGGPENLKLVDTDSTELREGYARISVSFAGVNHMDRLVLGGRLKWITLPHIPGAEFVGRFIEGSGAFRKGDRVAVHPKLFCGRCTFCMRGLAELCLETWNLSRAPSDLSTNMFPVSLDGGWSQECIVPEHNLFPLPESIPMADAAALPLSAMTAVHMVERAGVSPGEWVAVVGANGGVGTFLIQLLRMAGCRVIAVLHDEGQFTAAAELGAEQCLSRPSDFSSGILSVTDGAGADAIFDSIGAPTFSQALKALAPFGRYVTCGTLAGAVSEMNLLQLYSRELHLIGSTTGSVKHLASAISLRERGKLKCAISRIFNFEDVPKALSMLGTPGRFGKLIIRVND